MQHIAAVILAAGFSSRMEGLFKPMLPLGGSTVLAHVIRTFQTCGIRDIRVIAGHGVEQVKPATHMLDATVVMNPLYQSGMFSSVLAGLRTLDDTIQGFFVLPVDIPLVRPDTVRRMLESFRESSDLLLYPVFQGLQGHPPLISCKCLKKILAWQGQEGLKGALMQFRKEASDIEVPDEGILTDMDTRDDYDKIKDRFLRADIPTLNECQSILNTIVRVNKKVRNHCEAVANIACLIGKELNLHGCRLNIDRVVAAAMLHDVAREKPDHARAGADLLMGMGFDRVADIVAVHMDYISDDSASIDETAVVYLADKLVDQDMYVNPEKRFESKMKRYAHDHEAVSAIKQRLAQTLKVKGLVEAVIGIPLETLIKTSVEEDALL